MRAKLLAVVLNVWTKTQNYISNFKYLKLKEVHPFDAVLKMLKPKKGLNITLPDFINKEQYD